MANSTCRNCDRSADAGAYCSWCAAGIMAKALNPPFRGRHKKSRRPEVLPSSTSTQQRLFQ